MIVPWLCNNNAWKIDCSSLARALFENPSSIILVQTSSRVNNWIQLKGMQVQPFTNGAQFTKLLFCTFWHPTMTRVAKCQFFYTEQIFPSNFTPRKASKMEQVSNVNVWNWHKKATFLNKYWKLYHMKLFQTQKFMSVVTIYIQKIPYLTWPRVLPHFLPQPSNIFTQIYLPYLWHFATLIQLNSAQHSSVAFK